MTGLHAKCLATATRSGRDLICWKSKGHGAGGDPRRREHYDPSAGKRWTDEKES